VIGTPGHLELVDDRDAADLATFLGRARRLGATAVRLQASGRILAVTVCALAGSGLMGEGTVLGMRVFALADDAACDRTVGLDTVLTALSPGPREEAVDRRHDAEGPDAEGPDATTTPDTSEGHTRLTVPGVVVVEPWSGMSAPRGGWEPLGVLPGAELVAVAYEAMGIVEPGRPPNWYDPGRFWSGDDLPLREGWTLSPEIPVEVHGGGVRTTGEAPGMLDRTPRRRGWRRRRRALEDPPTSSR